MKHIIDLFSPNKRINKQNFVIMCIIQVLFVIGYWSLGKSTFMPSPSEIITSFGELINSENLFAELYESTLLAIQAVILTTLISLLISYATVLPFFRPMAYIISKMRFLSLVGLSFFFTMVTSSGHELKVSILVFGMSVFFVTSFCEVIASINKNEFTHARTLKMSEWQVIWEVIIIGKLDIVFEVIRQNFAIAWMMLTMVEGISRAEGGIGTLLLNQNKHFQLSAIFAIQITIFSIGVLVDYGFGVSKEFLFPYSILTKEHK